MIPRTKENSLYVLKVLYGRLPDPSMKCAFRADVINMVTDFAVHDDERWTLSIIEGWRVEPIESALLLSLSGRRLIDYVTPRLLKNVVTFALDEQAGVLFARTAHYFMQLLNGVLRYDPPSVLSLAADVVRASKPHGYNLDSLAMKEVVKLVEAILADHRSEIQDASSITCLLNLLDAFVEAGWPDALRLVWRLDEIYR